MFTGFPLPRPKGTGVALKVIRLVYKSVQATEKCLTWPFPAAAPSIGWLED